MTSKHHNKVVLITGTRKGIGHHLATHFSQAGLDVIGCSRKESDIHFDNYRHYCLDVTDEKRVVEMFADIRRTYGQLDVLINNAGIASMNHSLVTPIEMVRSVLNTNVVGTFLFSREAAKLMQVQHYGRIVNFTTVASPLKLQGEAIYAASKTAVLNLTQVFAKEFADFGITVNAIGPTPIQTDLIRGVPKEKIDSLIQMQAIRRFGEFSDVINVIDFFIHPESDFITGQVLYLGGV